MLIIAVPKSASSALVTTLGALHGLPNVSDQIRRREIRRCPVAPEYREVERFHRREVAEIDDAVVAAVSAPGSLAKLHFPPTANNQARLAHVRKVILLREPEEVILAYKRGNEAGVFNLHHPSFCFCFSEEAWMRIGRETGVLAELERFVAGWRAHAGEKLLVESHELVKNPAETIARVEAYLGLPRSGANELARERYTRDPGTRLSIPRLIFARRKIIAKRIARDAARLIARPLAGSRAP